MFVISYRLNSRICISCMCCLFLIFCEGLAGGNTLLPWQRCAWRRSTPTCILCVCESVRISSYTTYDFCIQVQVGHNTGFAHVWLMFVTSSGPSWLPRSPEKPWQSWSWWHGGHGSNCTRNHISKISGRIAFIGFRHFRTNFWIFWSRHDVMCSFLASSISTSPWAIWRRCECRKKLLECPTMQRSALRSCKSFYEIQYHVSHVSTVLSLRIVAAGLCACQSSGSTFHHDR